MKKSKHAFECICMEKYIWTLRLALAKTTTLTMLYVYNFYCTKMCMTTWIALSQTVVGQLQIQPP